MAGVSSASPKNQRQRPAFALVVEAGQDEDVLYRHDDDQRPQHQRDDAQHVVAQQGHGGEVHAWRYFDAGSLMVADIDVVDGFLEGVERAGADVAEHHADGSERKRPEP
jgi:hypothetical protein